MTWYDIGSDIIRLTLFWNILEKGEDPEGSEGSEENYIKSEGEHLYHN